MSIPLSFLSNTPSRAGASLGDSIAQRIDESNTVTTLLDCICSSDNPAIHSPDPSLPALRHVDIKYFLQSFSLPHSRSRPRLQPNDRVMVVLPTGPENAVALLAIACYHTCAPVNASCTASELKEDARRLGAKAIIATKDAQERLDLPALQKELGCDIIYIHDRASGRSGLFDMTVMGDDAICDSPSRPHGLLDQSLVLHTSGTSGKKKVVPYTLRSLIVGTWAVVHSWELKPNDVNLNMMPLFHVGGIVRNLLAPIVSGGSTIMCVGFDAMKFWSLATSIQATWYYASPTMHHAILASKPDSIHPDRNVRIRMVCNAAGGLLPSLAHDLKNTFVGAVVLPSYGMTECMPIATPPTNYQLERPGCSGIACGPELSIRAPNNLDREMPRKASGAVCVRGLPTFEGYEVTPDRDVPLDTSAFSSEGWFDSGDVGYMDEDGYLYITGRSKEIINRGGEVISPYEVEEAIMTAAPESIKSTLAFTIEHDVLQESIGVIIVPRSNVPCIGLLQLHDHLKDHLHPSKWPFAIVYMRDLPKNSAGKPLRIKLGQRLGLGCMSDSIPLPQRHFEASVPHPMAALSDPIRCSKVSVDLFAIEHALLSIVGVSDVAVRFRHDGNAEAFVSMTQSVQLSSSELREAISRTLPGYSLPDPVHIMLKPLSKTPSGFVDFNVMEQEVARKNSSAMSPYALMVRDIIADLLALEAGIITSDSDFFLLGGNSLLLGQLAYRIRKKAQVNLAVPSLFTNSTIAGIARLVETQKANASYESLQETLAESSSSLDDEATLNMEWGDETPSANSRGQNSALALAVQLVPFVFFYPMKAAVTWTLLLYTMSVMSPRTDHNAFIPRLVALLFSIGVARIGSRIITPIAAIAFKWIVIGKYQAGMHQFWSVYYLRWWIVNQALIASGRGIFSMHPSLDILYYRLLGAKIGKNVHISSKAELGEFDLLEIGDGCRIDSSVIRGFCVERNGLFRLENIVLGQNAVVNTYTQVTPGSLLAENVVYGPHASSLDDPSPPAFAAYNRTAFRQPHFLLKLLVAWPLVALVYLVAYVPWFAAIYLLLYQIDFTPPAGNALVSVVYWFALPERIVQHAISRMVRAVVTPVVHVAAAIAVKRLLGLNKPSSAMKTTQWALLRRYVHSVLLSQEDLNRAFAILGTHYEAVSIVYRAMGAKIGKRIYWPGSGIYCADPELLEIGNDVVFGSRSEIFTTDCIGSEKVIIRDGAMVADRVVILPGVTVGRRAVLGSGTLTSRNASYNEGSVWMGNDRGQAISLNKGKRDPNPYSSTVTPFGRAFYNGKADYWVFPYTMILVTNILMACFSASYWSLSAAAAAQGLRQLHQRFPNLHAFQETWYRLGIVYGWIACALVIVLNLQAILAVLWVIVTKWIVIGRRRPGSYDWDKSSYCQRWQLHLVLSQLMYKGYGDEGVLAPLTGSTFMVWFYRALGAKIGKDCVIYAGGKAGLMTEPDLVELGDNVALDNCSVVVHVNTRGNFNLNPLKIGNGCAMRTGSRLLSGASMEENSILCEHTLLTSGEVAEDGAVYVGWPARRMDDWALQKTEDGFNASWNDKGSLLPVGTYNKSEW